MSVPHPQVTDFTIGRLERYHRMEHIKQHFWKRFHFEYVSLLQQRTKWTTSTGQLSVGTLVLIKERGLPPLVWPLGRVTKVFPGSDGTTRVVELKTKKGTMVRAYNNVCPLPLTWSLQPGEDVRAPSTICGRRRRRLETAGGAGARDAGPRGPPHGGLKIGFHRLRDFNLQVPDFLPDIASISYYYIQKWHPS